jgi:hypothetical protein
VKKISFPLYHKAPDFSRAIYDAKNKIKNAEVSGLIRIDIEGVELFERDYTKSLGLHKLADIIYLFKSTAEELAKLLDADPRWLRQIEPHPEYTPWLR